MKKRGKWGISTSLSDSHIFWVREMRLISPGSSFPWATLPPVISGFPLHSVWLLSSSVTWIIFACIKFLSFLIPGVILFIWLDAE